MSTIRVTAGTAVHYKDWGAGQPIVFSHGWPLSSDAWAGQMLFFAQHEYRVIAHDRRGFGRSAQTPTRNDMDTYADDLAALLDRWINLISRMQCWLATRRVVARCPATSAGTERSAYPKRS